MKGLIILAAIFGLVDSSDWVQSPGSLMVTSASIFRVNKGKNVTPDELVAKFENSFVSLHRSSQFSDKNFFVLSGGSPVKLKREVVDGKKPVTPADLILDKEEFLTALRNSGLQLDTAGTKQFSLNEFKKVQELIDAAGDKKAPMTWLLLSKAISKEAAVQKEGEATADTNLAPAMDTSVLIEWGNTEVIKSAVSSLYSSAGGEQDKPTVSEQKIYERHFDKMPLKVELFLSRGDVFNDTAKQVNDVPLDGLFLVRSKFDKGSGYLLYLTGEDRRPKDAKAAGQRLVALEAPVFNVDKGQFQVQVDAKCFLENVIYPASGKNFQLPAVDSSGQFPPESAASQLLVADTKEGDKQRWSLKLNLNSAQVTSAPAASTEKTKTETPAATSGSAPSNNPRLEVDFPERATDSYSLRFSPGRDTTPPISDAVPVVIYDRNCKMISLVEQTKTAAAATPKIDKPGPLP